MKLNMARTSKKLSEEPKQRRPLISQGPFIPFLSKLPCYLTSIPYSHCLQELPCTFSKHAPRRISSWKHLQNSYKERAMRHEPWKGYFGATFVHSILAKFLQKPCALTSTSFLLPKGLQSSMNAKVTCSWSAFLRLQEDAFRFFGFRLTIKKGILSQNGFGHLKSI